MVLQWALAAGEEHEGITVDNVCRRGVPMGYDSGQCVHEMSAEGYYDGY